MTRFTTVLVALIASLGALALLPVTGASAASGQPGLAGPRTGSITQETPAPGGPRTWHVLIGGQAKDQSIQAEGYYPHVITIDAGDTVTWTLNTEKIHSVAFAGTCEHGPCIQPCVFTVQIDISPCGSPSYDGVAALDSSGRMVPAAYKWDNSIPRGGTTFSLTFTKPGVNIYFDLSTPGMRGVVIVHQAGTPYPFTQAQYSAQAQQQLRADLAAGARAPSHARPVTASANPDGTHTFRVALGASPPEKARAALSPAAGSAAHGSALLVGSGIGTSTHPTIAVTIRLAGLAPAVSTLPRSAWAPAGRQTRRPLASSSARYSSRRYSRCTSSPPGQAAELPARQLSPHHPRSAARRSFGSPAPAGSSTSPRALPGAKVPPQLRAAMSHSTTRRS